MSSSDHLKARVFIGSSSEGIAVARAVQFHLERVAEVTVWQDNAFQLNDGTLESLLKMLEYYDFAIFAFTPDDVVESRDKKSPCPRDNVVFEFGLFLGALSKARCFALASNDRDLKLPSDFHGVTFGRYDSKRVDGNLIAATATACMLFRDEIAKLKRRPKPSVIDSVPQAKHKHSEEGDASRESAVSDLEDRWGIELPRNSVLGQISRPITSWFHSERFTNAFPGVRGMVSIDCPFEAIQRLKILLEPPLAWVHEDDGVLGTTNPIWWWRGGNNCIDDFRQIDDRIVLLDYSELAIRKVVAVNSGAYWQSFVYVECDALPPIGLYQYDDDSFVKQVARYGYASEEYALFESRAITRAEYDDGAAIIDGRPVRTPGAELRVRYLSPYNFLISAQDSPINNGAFDLECEDLLNAILQGRKTVDDLITSVLKLPKGRRFGE